MYNQNPGRVDTIQVKREARIGSHHGGRGLTTVNTLDKLLWQYVVYNYINKCTQLT